MFGANVEVGEVPKLPSASLPLLCGGAVAPAGVQDLQASNNRHLFWIYTCMPTVFWGTSCRGEGQAVVNVNSIFVANNQCYRGRKMEPGQESILPHLEILTALRL